ncbi:MAG: tetratricopeptide repeat protein, partial [Acidobacteria bacterium]|nr:tetratricopeptide repeat protein [Acidobacteriota bacterium]
MTDPDGSIESIVQRLKLWLARANPGATAADLVEQMLASVRAPGERRLVSFHGLDIALPKPLDQSVKAINFQRESFFDSPAAPQIWWIPSHFLGFFLNTAPDLNSWFNPRLYLSEITRPPADRSTWAEPVADPEEARSQARSLITRAERSIQSGEPWLPVWHELVSPALAKLRAAGLHGDADTEARRLGDFVERLQGSVAQPVTATALQNLATVYREQGNFVAARRALERALEIAGSDEEKSAFRNDLAVILQNLGEHKAARQQIELALESDLRQFGPDHPTIAVLRSNLANILGALGEHQAARQQIDLALESALRQFGPDHPDVAVLRSNLASILGALGEHQAARQQIELALESDLRQFGPGHPNIAVLRSNLASILDALGEHQAARQQIDLALESALRRLGPGHPNVAVLPSNRPI